MSNTHCATVSAYHCAELVGADKHTDKKRWTWDWEGFRLRRCVIFTHQAVGKVKYHNRNYGGFWFPDRHLGLLLLTYCSFLCILSHILTIFFLITFLLSKAEGFDLIWHIWCLVPSSGINRNHQTSVLRHFTTSVWWSKLKSPGGRIRPTGRSFPQSALARQCRP